MTKKKLKLADIAELAGVSKSTVSFVLNGHAKKHRINQTTVEKVEQIARDNNYSPSIYARALKSQKTYTAGLVIPDLANMGFARIAKKLEQLCRSNGYQLLIASSEDDPQLEKQAIESLVDRQVDVLLIATSMTDDSFFAQIRSSAPIILFDRVVENGTFTSIKTDAKGATEQVVTQLVEGLDECIYIGGQLELSPSKDRFAGFKSGLEKAGVPFSAAKVFSKDYQPQSGYQMLEQAVTELGRPPKAIFTASYSLLEGVLRYLTRHQLLNSGIRIATFDNDDMLDCLPIEIDSVEQDCSAIAQSLFEAGKSLLNDPMHATENIVLPAKIHYRRASS
ncbi:LacI family DNA-binding transcriptional regulator [Vibrio brasiliensis]|uniref:substrate-binding domain-containing protein n=1 Tax=Vibrio brasiliensis TaxID=170652 RepID=UPI001EFD1E30|nr:LacI family DNA-binding transcriptional regulator [Vibrio brasiliensis]MCG9750512.1 LacI family DNA-binding transcriptional regulator [Vibrio brasiliensis]